jgi:DNA polymerase-1
VPKVGPKTAVKWLDAYGSLDAIVAHADEIGGAVGENLRGTSTSCRWASSW